MNHLGLAVDADVRFHSEMPLVALLRLVHLRSRFFVELGASMMVASAMVPVVIRTPLACRYRFTDQCAQLLPRHDLLHLFQKRRSPRLLGVALESGHHRQRPCDGAAGVCPAPAYAVVRSSFGRARNRFTRAQVANSRLAFFSSSFCTSFSNFFPGTKFAGHVSERVRVAYQLCRLVQSDLANWRTRK